MKVVVGSQNPVKLASAERAFQKYFPNDSVEVRGTKTDSGVSDQPMTITETMQGAINRAKSASNSDADFSVGIEGGLSFHVAEGEEIGFEMSFVCVYDCKTGEYEISSSHGYRIYPHVLEQIKEGKNLSDAMHAEYGIAEIGKNNGVIGWLTNNEITRESSAHDGILLALSALLKEEKR